MKTDFEIIQENINSIEFKFLIRDIFSCDKHLDEIAGHMNKNRWFFTTKEIKAVNNLKKIIANYKNDRRIIVNNNKINGQINRKRSTIFKKNLSHSSEKYTKNYLIPILNEAYITRLLKKEKIKSLFNIVKNSLKKKDKKYKELIRKLVRGSKVDKKIEKRIESLIPILNTLNQKDFKEAIKVFNKNKDKNNLIKTLTSKKIFHYYVPIYNIEVDEKNIKLNEFIEVVDITDFRKKFNKYQLYDTFIDIMRNSLYARTKLVHFKISCVGKNKSFDLFKRYYELFIDIISFLQPTLTIELDVSQKRFFYFKINKKHLLPGFNHETTLISYWGIYKETKKYFKSFTFLFKDNLEGIYSKILNSLKYKRKAEFSIFKEDKLLYYIIALESLLLDASDWKSKKRKDLLIIEKINSLITYYPEFKNLPKKIETLYKLRNRIVHTGKHIIKIDEDGLKYLSRTITSIIGIYLSKKRYKHLRSVINNIKKGKKKFYNREKERLTKLGLSLNKSYSLKAELFQNKNKLCDIKAKIKVKDLKDDYLLDPVLEDIRLKNIPSNLQATSIDKFYIKGTFGKFKIEKTEVSITMTDLIILSRRCLSFLITDNKHKMYRLKNSLDINKVNYSKYPKRNLNLLLLYF